MMKNIIPISSLLTRLCVPFKRWENMGVELNLDDLNRTHTDKSELFRIAGEPGVRNHGYDFNGNTFWRLWIAGKVPEWDNVFEGHN